MNATGKNCLRCGQFFSRDGHAASALRCLPCASEHTKTNYRHMRRAAALVAAAVRKGALPPARDLSCVDCGAPADGYDHRDYTKPLDVEPCCLSCNKKRGPGYWPFDMGIRRQPHGARP